MFVMRAKCVICDLGADFFLYTIYMFSCLQRVNEIHFFTESLAVRYFQNNAVCTKNQGLIIFEVRNQNWWQHTSGFEITFSLEFLAFPPPPKHNPIT